MNLQIFLSRLHASLVFVLALFVAVLVYAATRPYHKRLDFTQDKLYSLSEASKQLVAEFGIDPIRLLAFYPPDHPDKQALEDLLKAYAYFDPHLTYRFINPDRAPSFAEKHRVDAYGVIVIQARGREVRLETVSEEDVTNALAKLLSNERRTVYFVTGHEEPKLEDRGRDGFLGLSVRIKGLSYEMKEIDIERRDIPKDAALLMLAGPHEDLSLKETVRLRTFFDSGGHLLIAIDPVLPGEGLHLASFLHEAGIAAGSDVVVDTLSRRAGGDFLISMAMRYAPHPALENFKIPIFLPVARSIRKSEKEIPGIQVEELAMTGDQAWAEADLTALEKGKAEYDEGTDLPGPVPLAAVAENERGGKILVLGDSDMMNNAHLHLAGNKRFLMRLIGWMLDEKPIVRIQELGASISKLFLSARQERFLFFFCVVVVPGFFLGLGIAVHILRQRSR